MFKKLIIAVFICAAAAIPLHAAENTLIEEVSRESLLVPESAFLDETGALDISKWGTMEYTDRTAYVRNTVLNGLAFYMSGADSPERDFMIAAGWTPALAERALALTGDLGFFENISARTGWSADEYELRRDLVRATVLCRNGTEHCIAHRDTVEPYNGPYKDTDPCDVIQVPSLRQIILWQALVESVFREAAAGYVI
ncbi:MAG: hypothetical protein PHF33_09975 [Candidatus Delongbacteria bacterium]|nr:hypothetical protein [Candidatus Delongbacteria bacterium]